MIYKIITDFSNLQDIIKNFSKDFNILFHGNCLYICSKNMNNVSSQKIKKILKNDNVFLTQIDDKNIRYESDYVQQWCISYFIKKDIDQFEKEQQQLIKEYMNVLDDCEKQLENILQKGG